MNAEVVHLGLIDTPEKAMRAGHQFRQADVDLIFLVTVQVPLSIFLDKSLRIGYRMVDECENGSPRRAIKYSGE
jgi:hypothetical protein